MLFLLLISCLISLFQLLSSSLVTFHTVFSSFFDSSSLDCSPLPIFDSSILISFRLYSLSLFPFLVSHIFSPHLVFPHSLLVQLLSSHLHGFSFQTVVREGIFLILHMDLPNSPFVANRAPTAITNRLPSNSDWESKTFPSN